MNRVLMSSAEFGFAVRPQHIGIEALRGDDANGDHGRQQSEGRALEYQCEFIARGVPFGGHPMPRELTLIEGTAAGENKK